MRNLNSTSAVLAEIDKAIEAKNLLEELLLTNSGFGIAKDIHKLLTMAMQSETWRAMDAKDQSELTFRILAVNEFFVDLKTIENKKQ